MSFYHPTDGYLYGWRWSNGDEAWWSTQDLALRHPQDIANQPGEPIRRRYLVGEVEAWDARPKCGDMVTDPSGGERVCTLVAGHLGPWHDDGVGCWPVADEPTTRVLGARADRRTT